MASILSGPKAAATPEAPSPAEQREDQIRDKRSEQAAVRNQALRARTRRSTRSLLNPGLGVPGVSTGGNTS